MNFDCRTLCDGGANVNIPNAKGETPLYTAVRRGDEQIVRQLLAAGADPSKKTDKGDDAFSIATAKGGALLPLLSMDKLARTVRRTHSVESVDYDRASITSSEAISSQLFVDKAEKYPEGKPESWTDLIWPQPKLIRVNAASKGFPFPKDNRLKIYFCDASSGCPRRMMQAIQISVPLLSNVGLELDYRGHKTADHDNSPLDGKVTCGIYADGRPSGSYSLTIDPHGVEIVGSDYCGVRYAFATFVQVVRLQKFALRRTNENGSPSASGGFANGWIQPSDSATGGHGLGSGDMNSLHDIELPGLMKNEAIPCLTVRDQPDRPFRAIFQDFSGCRILNTETLLQLATRLSYCKANFLFVNFEVRTTDRYQLPYTNRDLFHMMQVCEELFVTLVPSLDTQSNYIDPSAAREIIEHFLDDFPLSKTAHFGPNLASILIANKNVLAAIQRRVPKIFLSSQVDEKNSTLLSSVPSYVTLCIEGGFPFEAERLLSPRVSVVLKFSTGDDGYLCAAPDSTAKKALLAARLGEKCNVLGTMVCDLSTGCEAMPPSLSYMSLMASLGVAWNGSCDMKKFAFLQPAIAAHHLLMDGDMTALFEQVATLGRVEHELTKFSCGIWRPPTSNAAASEDGETSAFTQSKKMPISVFVEMILNPENLNLERLTPVIFKKARIELRRSLMALDAARKTLPYNFELALVLAEIKLVTELMVLTSRLGQALCMHRTKPPQGKNRDEVFHYSPGRVGVAHLPLTVRTDLANRLVPLV
ncbi:ankyrin repeat protein [Cooperia oncophora]